MARGHGRILTSIWEDADFLTLTEGQQRLYLFLISQPNLNHAGLLPLTLRRWARKALGLTAAEVEKHLQALAAARFIVLDDDTEELLIRSFVRNDGVWKQPKVMGAMVSGAMEISSRALQTALLDEMDRIPLDELSDEPTKVRGVGGPSIRRQVAEHIQALRKAFDKPTPDPTQGGYATPSTPPSEGDTDAPTEGDRKGSTRVGACAHDARAPLPLPLSPTPVPIQSVVEEGEETSGSSGPGEQRPNGLALLEAPIDIDGFTLTDSMRAWALRTFGPGLDLDYETAQFLDHFRGSGSRRPNWPAEWQKWIRRSAKYASERANRPPLRAVSGGHTPYRNPINQDDYDAPL